MNKNILLLFSHLSIFIFYLNTAEAQYYYKDIMSTRQINKEFSILKNNNIKAIKVTSFDNHDKPSEGFLCEKNINKDYTQSEMISKSYITGQSLLVTDYDATGKIIKSVTSTPTVTNTVVYQYDSTNHLSLIHTTTKGDRNNVQITESHEYFYTTAGTPVKMLRKKNNILIATIHFKSDEDGNIIEENATGKSTDKKYYYYYDDSNRLTDVVHYNPVAKRLLPDYMLEYTSTEKPSKITSIDESGRNYYIWRYAYGDNKLPEIEKCYSKERKLLGTIQYEYQ